MKKEETFNIFLDGLCLDLNPLSMPNSELTNCLNGTILTYNGNEYMLLNDMGNCRIETAMLPSGYIPLGSTSFGGIIYIVSYNPLDKKYLIGSFPSPERNLSKDELGDESNTTIDLNNFCEGNWTNDEDKFGSTSNIITNYYQKVNLFESPVYPGDKYKVFSNNINNIQKYVSAWKEGNTDATAEPNLLKFEIVSTLKNGKMIDISNNSVWTSKDNTIPPYYIYNGDILLNNNETDLDEYRGLVGSNYDTYVNNESGQLGIVAKLEVPTSFSVGYDVLPTEDGNKYLFYFYLNWTNDITNSKHKYKNNPIGIKYTVKHSDSFESSSTYLSFNKDSEPFTEYPKDGDDNYLTLVAPDGFYEDNFDINTYLTELLNVKGIDKRYNDGSDFLFVVKGPLVEKKDEILTIDICPVMSFGLLKFLNRTLTIDTSKINKGDINILNYNYYINEDDIKVNFNVEAYPEPGKTITSDSRIKLYPLKDYISQTSELLKQETYDEESNDLNLTGGKEIEINNGMISGVLEISIPRKDLIPNIIYIVQFELDYSTKKRYFYRLLFNTPIYNSAYGKVGDFKDLYLYDSEKDYGILLKLNYDNNNSVNQISADPNNEIPSQISVVREDKKVLLNYNAIHLISSSLNTSTGLDDLNVILSNENLDAEIKVNYDSEITVNQIEEFPKVEVSTNFISIKNEFNCTIPYILQYNQSNPLNEYELVRLKCNDLPASLSLINDIEDGNNTKNIVAVWVYAKGREEGQLKLHINGVNKVEELIVNNLNRKYVETSSIESQLRKYMRDNNYDYLDLYIGVQYFGDGNCGIGLTSDSYLGYRFGGNNAITEGIIKLRLIKVNCIRYGDSVRIVHNRDINLQKLTRDLDTPSFTKDFDNRIVNENFYKYQKSGTVKQLYSVGSFNNPIYNPTIDTKYEVKFNTNVNQIKIGDVTISIKDDNGNNNITAKNLCLTNLYKTVINIEQFNQILNEDFINDMLSFTNIYSGYYKDQFLSLEGFLSQEDLSTIKKLVDHEYENVDFLTIDNNESVTFNSNRSDWLNDTEWYFAWESIDDALANSSGLVNKDDLLNMGNKGEKLSCILQYTHAYYG